FKPHNGAGCIASGADGLSQYSTDGGVNWTSSSGLPTSLRIEEAYAPSSDSIVYASCEYNSGTLYRSPDSGQSFSLVNSGVNYFASEAGEQGWYDNTIWVNPVNPNFIIVGGIDLWRSTDGGVTLTKISDWTLAPNS